MAKTYFFFSLFFGQKTTSKAIPNSNGTENRRKSHPTPSPNALFRLRVRFWAILGSQMGGKFHEKCVRRRVRKNTQKKNTNTHKHVLGRRHALGQRGGKEGSCDSLRTGSRSTQLKLFSKARRPSAKGGGFQRLRLMPPTPSDLGFEILRFEV